MTGTPGHRRPPQRAARQQGPPRNPEGRGRGLEVELVSGDISFLIIVPKITTREMTVEKQQAEPAV